MKTCRYCASSIQNEARVCPHCRKKQRAVWPTIIAIVAALWFIGLMLQTMGVQ